MGCKSSKDTTGRTLSFEPGPATMVYKTQKDYRMNVPIRLSEDKSQIVSYPDPQDVRLGDQLAIPIQLDKGYLLDERGISANVAFTSYTYQEYAALPGPPSYEELMASIIDKDPLTFLCDCGNRMQFQEIENELNALIKQEKLAPCRELINREE